MSILDDAFQIAERLVPGAPIARQLVQTAQQIGGALETLSAAEQSLLSSSAHLQQMAQLGIATKDDFAAYDTVRANLFDSEVGLYGAIRSALQQVSPEALARIPAPTIAPGLRKPRKLPKLADPGTYPVFLSFGYPGAVKVSQGAQRGVESGAAAGEGLGAWQLWAAGVLAVLAALALMAIVAYFIITEGSGLIAHIVATREQTKQLESLYAARLSCFQSCAGGQEITPELRASCVESCGLLLPTPEEALPELKMPGQRDEINWFFWGMVTAGVLVGGYLLYRSDWGQRTFRPALRGPRRRRGVGGPRRIPDLDGPSTYNLEVQR